MKRPVCIDPDLLKRTLAYLRKPDPADLSRIHIIKELEEIDAHVPDAYDRNYGDDKRCANCGHAYYRHFDTYDDMEPVGCKYCNCWKFVKAFD